MDDSTLIESGRQAAATGNVLRGAELKLAMAEAAYGGDISALVEAAAQEDVEAAAVAFERLVDRYMPRVVSICYSFFPDVDEACFLARGVCRRVWLARSGLDPTKNFKAYLYTTARNFCIELLRKDASRGPFSWSQLSSTDSLVDFDEGEGRPRIELVPDPASLTREQRFHVKETVERVLSRLSPVQRFVLLQRFDDGYSRAEIAAMLQCTEQTVGNHERKARKIFKDYFSQEWSG